jgi:integrase
VEQRGVYTKAIQLDEMPCFPRYIHLDTGQNGWSEWCDMAGKSRKAGQRLLVLKHNRWWFRRAIPSACQSALGRGQFYMVNLDTSDLKAAQRLRDELEKDTAEAFAAILSGTTVAAATLTAREQGILHREAIAAAAEVDEGEPDTVGPLEAAIWSAESTAESFREETERDAFSDALQGREDVGAHVEAYLAGQGFAPKTVGERRGNIGRFVKWAAAQRPAVTLDRIDRKQAGKYVSAEIDPMHPQTQKKHLAALRGYWRWLASRGHVELPPGALLESGWPWDGQRAQRSGKRAERGDRDRERPFTEEEAKALLYAPFPSGRDAEHESQIRDAIRLSMLSGMRMAEILTLWVEEVGEGPEGAGLVFDIQQGKTEAAARPVPVHPDLLEIVQRRLKDADGRKKAGTDWLFHELADERDPGDTFGKRFRRYRLALGIDDKRDGKRRSLVNFHSARRWFATTADRAGQQEAVIKDVIGHVPDKKNVTRNSYIYTSSGPQMRACVESVKLPVQDALA